MRSPVRRPDATIVPTTRFRSARSRSPRPDGAGRCARPEDYNRGGGTDRPMTTLTVTTPHPIYLAGRWVDSPDVLLVTNPARDEEIAGTTYQATEAQYEEAVTAAVSAFEETRRLPSYERG